MDQIVSTTAILQAIPFADLVEKSAPHFNEGEKGEFRVQVCESVTADQLGLIRDEILRRDVMLIEPIYEDTNGVIHIKFQVAILPVWIIALIAGAVLLPLGIGAWQITRMGPGDILKVLLPITLVGVGGFVLYGLARR